MAPESSSTVLPSDSTNPSVPERIICHSGQTKLKDALILNGIYSHVFDTIAIRPNIDTEPRAHANWGSNDWLAITFMKLLWMTLSIAISSPTKAWPGATWT
ncbi:hypothetical protein C0989_003257 [Termitomyces sp. Mn162]|nr:hypothetical protein C0989_003257 [Termitomyces sp. Mn162]